MHQEEPQDLDQQQFQILAQDHSQSPQDIYFDHVYLALQQIIFDPQFQQTQNTFMRKHCSIFHDSQQNKIEYMEVFKLYSQEIQQYVQHNLQKRVEGFDMKRFTGLLEGRTEQIDQQILDMLESFTQFEAFKKIMLEFKTYMENQDNLKLLTVKSNKLA